MLQEGQQLTVVGNKDKSLASDLNQPGHEMGPEVPF